MPSATIKEAPAPVTRRLSIPVGGDFNFERAVQGHGWYDLPPFQWDAAALLLSRSIDLPRGGTATLAIGASVDGGPGGRLRVALASDDGIDRAAMDAAAAQVRHMLRLDEDLGDFYRQAGRVARPDLRWARQVGAGRLLRAPSVFEDLVKMICTTNCTWALTKVMVTALVERLGMPAPGGLNTFPSPEVMAAARPRFYREIVRAGYRAEPLRDLARAVAAGRLDPERWADPLRPTGEIREEILSVKGAGDYVADNMLKLLGRYDGLGIDSWCRRKFSEMYHKGRTVGDRRITTFYAPFGRWRGLALWCDITKDWFEGGNPLATIGGKVTGTGDRL